MTKRQNEEIDKQCNTKLHLFSLDIVSDVAETLWSYSGYNLHNLISKKMRLNSAVFSNVFKSTGNDINPL